MLEDENDKSWQKVLSGKNLPAVRAEEEQEADKIRQYLLWRKAQKTPTQLSPQQAAAFYQHIQAIDGKRRPNWSRWLKWFLIGLVLIAISVGSWWLGKSSSTGSAGNTTTSHEPMAVNHMVSSTSSSSNQQQVPTLSTDYLPQTIPIGKTAVMPDMLSIPSGSYTMGCSAGWDDVLGGCRENEYPAHPVDVVAFELSQYEITVGQFKHFVAATGYVTTAEAFAQGCVIKDKKTSGWTLSKAHHWQNAGFPQTDVHPVVCLSWIDTQAYLQWLNQLTGNHYRLATEEEWEYAARADQVTAFYWGSKAERDFANYSGKGKGDLWQYTSPVGQFSSNNFGLHDMSGNVWEWVQDCWRNDYQTAVATHCDGNNVGKTRRGGSWDNRPPSIRSAYRNEGQALDRSHVYGFRIAHDAVKAK